MYQSQEICCSPGVAFPDGCSSRPSQCWVVESFALRTCVRDDRKCLQGERAPLLLSTHTIKAVMLLPASSPCMLHVLPAQRVGVVEQLAAELDWPAAQFWPQAGLLRHWLLPGTPYLARVCNNNIKNVPMQLCVSYNLFAPSRGLVPFLQHCCCCVHPTIQVMACTPQSRPVVQQVLPSPTAAARSP